MELSTDASSTIGCGEYYKRNLLSEEWPKELKFQNQPPSMAFLEIYPIVVAGILYGNRWKRKKIIFYCNNAAVVDIRKRRSSDLEI